MLAFASGNLCYQIEHHLFPDLPSNRYPQIAVRVRALCDKYDLPYTTGSLAHQYFLTLRTIHKLALPDSLPDRHVPRRARDRVGTEVLARHVGHRTGQSTFARRPVRGRWRYDHVAIDHRAPRPPPFG